MVLDIHPYFSRPDLFYKTKLRSMKIGNFSLILEEIQDLDECIDFQCSFIEQNPFPDNRQSIIEDYCPYFAVLWDSACNLTAWCADNENALQHKSILEIGAGLALPSLYLAKCSYNITATDYHPHTLHFAKLNQQHNEVTFPYIQKSWSDLKKEKKRYDVIIGSDILYEGKYIHDLLSLCNALLLPHGEIIICDPVRGYLQEFINMAKKDFVIALETLDYNGKEHFLIRCKKNAIAF